MNEVWNTPLFKQNKNAYTHIYTYEMRVSKHNVCLRKTLVSSRLVVQVWGNSSPE